MSVEEVIALIDERIKTIASEDVPLGDVSGRVLAADDPRRRACAAVRPGGDGRLRDPGRGNLRGRCIHSRPLPHHRPIAPRPAVSGHSRSRRGRRDCHREPRFPRLPMPSSRSRSSESEADILRVVEATPPARHVGRRGEDIAAGTDVLRVSAGYSALKTSGILSALGLSTVPVDPPAGRGHPDHGR